MALEDAPCLLLFSRLYRASLYQDWSTWPVAYSRSDMLLPRLGYKGQGAGLQSPSLSFLLILYLLRITYQLPCREHTQAHCGMAFMGRSRGHEPARTDSCQHLGAWALQADSPAPAKHWDDGRAGWQLDCNLVTISERATSTQLSHSWIPDPPKTER